MTKEQEFAELLREYGDVAYRMACQLTGGREAEARDLVQDVFIKAWKHWDMEKPGCFKAWMYRLLHNLYVDHVRKRVRHPTLSLDFTAPDSDSAWEQSLPDHDLHLEDRFEQNELKARVDHALQQLPEEFRMPIILCDLEGLSYDEIAEVLACPVGTVRSRIHRGRGQLRRALRAYMDGAKEYLKGAALVQFPEIGGQPS